MKSMSAGLITALSSDSARLAFLWRISRRDGGGSVYLTSHDENITLAGITYVATQGTVGSALSFRRGLDADNMEAMVLLDSSSITRDDLLAGVWDGAEVAIYLVEVGDPLNNRMTLADGWRIGKITIEDNKFRAELLSKADRLKTNIVEIYSPTCRAQFCDARCGLDAEDYTVTGVVFTAFTNKMGFIDVTRTETTDCFSHGLLRWTGGANTGYSMEVKNYIPSQKRFELFLPMIHPISPLDTYSVLKGCGKDSTDCQGYGNIVNFRGEPFVPGGGVLPITKDPDRRWMWDR